MGYHYERGDQMQYGFSALLARMNYIGRWGLMRNTRTETLSEHTLCVATTAHILACIATEMCGADDVAPQKVACAALYHDAPEILTGDLPTPVKYANARIREEYGALEDAAAQQILSMLPPEAAKAMQASITGEDLTAREARIVKAADKLSALMKCMEERGNGNTEFKTAEATTRATIEAMKMPEVDIFVERFLPAHNLTLDELLALTEE